MLARSVAEIVGKTDILYISMMLLVSCYSFKI